VNTCSDYVKKQIKHYYLSRKTKKAGRDLFAMVCKKFGTINIDTKLEISSEIDEIKSKSLDDKRTWINKISNFVFDLTEDSEFYQTLSPEMVNCVETALSLRREQFESILLMHLSKDYSDKLSERFGDQKIVFYDDVVNYLETQTNKALSSSATSNSDSALVARSNFKGSNRGPLREPPICRVCQKGKHFYNECPVLKQALKSSTSEDKPKSSTAKSGYQAHESWISYLSSDDTLPTSPGFNTNWILDTGCTTHMTNNVEKFSSLNKTLGPKVNGIAGTVEVKGYGSVPLDGINLSKVAYVPDLPVNLISVQQAASSSGCCFLFSADSVSLISPDGIIKKVGTVVDNLYTFSLDSSTSSTNLDCSSDDVSFLSEAALSATIDPLLS